jgi:hypothetical protein
VKNVDALMNGQSKGHKHKHKDCQSTAGNPQVVLSWDSLIYPKDTWAGQQ